MFPVIISHLYLYLHTIEFFCSPGLQGYVHPDRAVQQGLVQPDSPREAIPRPGTKEKGSPHQTEASRESDQLRSCSPRQTRARQCPLQEGTTSGVQQHLP